MSCCVVGCRNRFTKNDGLHFYRIPAPKTPIEAKRRHLWLRAIRRADWTDEIIRNARVCSAHFISGKASMDPQSPDYVPSLFPCSSQSKAAPKKMERFNRRRRRAEGISRSSLTDTSSCVTAAATVEPTADFQQPLGFEEELCPHTQPVSEKLLPSLQQCNIKVEQIPVVEETKIQEHPLVKEEQVDQCISPDTKADTWNDTEVRLPKSEPTTNPCELFPSSTAVTGSVNESIKDECTEHDDSSSPLQIYSIEVFVELEQPPREEKSCRFCGKRFKRDSHLIRHVDLSHKGHKAFKCLGCNKEFEQRYQLVLHIRIHTGEKPFSCDYCEKTFSQNSSRIVHMRVHTGEKPYLCKKCGKSFATSKHFRFCKVQNECKITPEEGNIDEDHKEEKAFKCMECNKEFNQKHQLILHKRIHTGEKPFSCDFCGKTFTQKSSRIVHMRQHTGEKPYFCKKCDKRFASSRHLKLCTGRENKNTNKSFRCTTCGRSFHTDSNLKVHMEVHESWKRHISEKLQGPESEEKT